VPAPQRRADPASGLAALSSVDGEEAPKAG
jgi:hypothetical protein